MKRVENEVRKDLEVGTGEMKVMMSEKREIVDIMSPGKKKEEESEIVMIAVIMITLIGILGEIALLGMKSIIQMMIVIVMKVGLMFHIGVGAIVIINFIYNG